VQPACSARRLSEWSSQPEIVIHELSKEPQPENQVASNQGPEPGARESASCKPPRPRGADQQKPRNREAEVIRIEERSTTTAESIDEHAPANVEVRVKQTHRRQHQKRYSKQGEACGYAHDDAEHFDSAADLPSLKAAFVIGIPSFLLVGQ